ncbi:MAG: nitrogenase component 1 [Clostridiales bacterium]|nr:nitrogenase component 1 [Clostridiales bacterium]
MKGLLKYLSPFAPDQSGAASVFYELGGIIVICDAGGCTGNICGFDEPRWFEKKSALFSAGLRDMDAILGRDDRLVDKLKDAADRLDAKFAVLIGTPVPAVIATDFRALKRMAEKKCGFPVLTVECTGTRLYDRGAEEAYLELFRRFAEKNVEKDKNAVGVIGVNPLDVSQTHADQILREKLKKEGFSSVYCYGMGDAPKEADTSDSCDEKDSFIVSCCGEEDNLTAVKKAGTVAKNIVVAPSGIRAAQYLEKEFGTPYEVRYPFLPDEFREKLHALYGKKVLIVHQQVAANEIRREILVGNSSTTIDGTEINAVNEKKSLAPEECGECSDKKNNIICGSWFMQVPQLKESQDVFFEREDEFISFVENGYFDAIVGDARFRRALRGFQGEFVECPHFAVSGTISD